MKLTPYQNRYLSLINKGISEEGYLLQEKRFFIKLTPYQNRYLSLINKGISEEGYLL